MFRVFQHHVSAAVLLDALLDGLLGFIAVLMAGATIDAVQHGLASLSAPDLSTLLAALGFALSVSLMLSVVGLYRHQHLSPAAVAWRLGAAVTVGGYLTYLLLKELRFDGHPALLLGYAAIYLLLGVVVLRVLVHASRRLMGTRRVLVVGTDEEAVAVAEEFARGAGRRDELVGYYPVTAHAPIAVDPRRVFSRSDCLEALVRRLEVDEVIVAAREQRGGTMPMDQLLAVRTRGIPVLDRSAFFERTRGEVPLDSLKASWLVYGSGFVQSRARRVAKRAFDIVSSSLLLLIASPVMLLTALLIRLDSPGPVIYRQERVGLGGRGFMCLKFRSMRTDAEKDGVARWATKNDDRVTRIGRFIRKTRIDELPQLISVLKGEMSMVGPRPERPSFVAQLREQIPFYDLRHSIKPGVTGWAQVRYAYGASVDDARRKHQFDLYYVKNNSIWLDFFILIETITVVLFREGAQ
jgi:sugar transferase (PEP-CTERM system associated)